jgi:putative ABC transport system ATP-binding protein
MGRGCPQLDNSNRATGRYISPYRVLWPGAERHAVRDPSKPYNEKPFSITARLTVGRLPRKGSGSMSFFSKPAQPVPQVDTITAEAVAPNALIGLRNIEKSYAHGTSRTYVLRRINLDVKEGEFISIMGPSGAGKSTLLHIIGMHDSAWTGEYYFLDQPVHKLGAKERAKLHKQYIGFVFQSYHLLDHLTVYENLDIPLSYRDIKKSERESMVCDILDKFSIVGKKDLYPNQLSGGQQQLVAVARAVISNPKVILADEPTGNLHTSQGKEIMELFKKLNEGGTTIIQVTHSEVNAGYGSRIIHLRDGWIVDE